MRIPSIFILPILIVSFGLFLIPEKTQAFTLTNYIPNTLGLVAHWTFDGKDMPGGRVFDVSGKENHGSQINTATSTSRRMGKIAQSFFFDGVNDYINMGSGSSIDDIELQGGGGMTLAFWIKPAALTVTSIMHKGGGSSQSWEIELNSTGRITFVRSYDTTDLNIGYNSQLATNEWRHVVFTWSGADTEDSVALYTNGVLQSQSFGDAGEGTKLADAGNDLYLSSFFAGDGFSGDLDDIRLYNRVLTATEIGHLADQPTSKQNVSISGTSVSKGLVGHWTFDGKDMPSGQVRDVSGQGNHGSQTNMSTSTAYTPGKIGQALNLDGVDDFINVGSGSSLDDLPSGSGMSVSMWIKLRSLGPIASNQAFLIAKETTGSGGIGWLLQTTAANSLIRFRAFFSGDDLVVDSANAYSMSEHYNQWNHITITWDGSATASNVRMYKNGVELTYSTQTNATGTYSSDASQSLLIGDALVTSNRNTDGAFDDVRIYNRVLSAAEIRHIYNQSAASKVNISIPNLSSGLIGYWTFDGKDMPSGQVRDVSGQGNHGSQTNMSTSTAYSMGKIGQALRFDGTNDYISIADSNAFTFSTGDTTDTPMTFSAWVKKDGIQNNISGGAIVAKTGTTATDTPFEYIFYVTSTDQLKLTLYDNNGGRQISKTSTNTITDYDQWVHYAATYTGNGAHSGITLYRNGVAIAGTGASAGTYVAMENSNKDVKIGSAFFTDGSFKMFFKGSLDDVRVYNRTLSAAEIVKLYNGN